MGDSRRSGAALPVSADGANVIVDLSVRLEEPAADWAATVPALASELVVAVLAEQALVWDLGWGFLAFVKIKFLTFNVQRSRSNVKSNTEHRKSNSLQPLAINLIDAREAADEVNILLIGEGVITGRPSQLAWRFGMVWVVNKITFDFVS